jgi:hypothetical protein
MIVTIGGIPVYDAIITDEDCGMFKISLVDDPAVMSNFQAFDNKRKTLLYAIENEEKRLVRGCIMRADFPIYRTDEKMGEYYVIYKAEEIRKMAEKYLLESRQNDVNLMHQDGTDVEGVQMVQYFIKGDGVSVEGFDECADGSLFGEFHIVNDDIWEEIKAGTYRGFSLEGVFDLVPERNRDEVQEIVDDLAGKFKNIINQYDMAKLKKVKAVLARLLQGFGNVTTDKGILAWDGEEDLKAGDAVYIEDAEGNRSAAEDGDYKTADGKVIVVVDGKVAEIKDAEAEVSPEEGEGTEADFLQTDKGKLEWDNEDRDLQEGDEVFITDEEGNRNPAPDGDYTTEDGKVIKVADGKVTEIVDPKAEVAPQEEDLNLKRQEKFTRTRELYEESFNEKTRQITEAIGNAIGHDRFYLVDAGEDFGVAEVFDEDYLSMGYFRYAITWNEDGSANAGEPVEVKLMFVPMDFVSPFEKGAEESEEMKALKAENEALQAEVEKLRKMPAAKPAHQEFQASQETRKTGVKGLDRLQEILSAK